MAIFEYGNDDWSVDLGVILRQAWSGRPVPEGLEGAWKLWSVRWFCKFVEKSRTMENLLFTSMIFHYKISMQRGFPMFDSRKLNPVEVLGFGDEKIQKEGVLNFQKHHQIRPQSFPPWFQTSSSSACWGLASCASRCWLGVTIPDGFLFFQREAQQRSG